MKIKITDENLTKIRDELYRANGKAWANTARPEIFSTSQGERKPRSSQAACLPATVRAPR